MTSPDTRGVMGVTLSVCNGQDKHERKEYTMTSSDTWRNGQDLQWTVKRQAPNCHLTYWYVNEVRVTPIGPCN